MAVSKVTKIVLVVLFVSLLLNVLLLITTHSIRNNNVDGDLIVVDSCYREQMYYLRDSLNKKIDTIFVTIDTNTVYEKELNKVINDSDSVAIVKQFIYLCTEPIE